jgi:hypothetical protein
MVTAMLQFRRHAERGLRRGDVMAKYLIEWKTRDGLAGDESQPKRLLDVFSKWTPAASNILQMVSKVDNSGGLSLVETDDVTDLLRDTAKFSVWLEFAVTPVIDITEAVPVFNEAQQYLDSIPK